MTNHPRSHGGKFKKGQVVYLIGKRRYYRVRSGRIERGVWLAAENEDGKTHLNVNFVRPLTKKEAGR